MALKLSVRGARDSARNLVVGAVALASSAVILLALAGAASADRTHHLVPGSLLVSSSEYRAASITPGETLPVGCTPTTSFGGVSCATAAFDGTYPTVFNNAPIDASFGVTSPIFLDDLAPNGSSLYRIHVPTDQMVTSFSSKSELALNFSSDGRNLTFMGYAAPVDGIDVSNSNTPGVVDPSNPVPQSYYRRVGDLNRDGRFSFTDTNAYSGNNGRAAILDPDNDQLYTAGNAGNGNNPQPDGVILGAGAQIFSPGVAAPDTPTPVGSFNQTQVGAKADKVGKDTNFRGLAIYRNVVYLTKGSGGNGIDTVYFIDTTGTACPSTSATPGVGVPVPGAPLPSAINYDPSVLQTKGVYPYNMCVLKGFNTVSQKAKNPPPFDPFGIWFANPDTLYVADEGDGSPAYDASTNTYTDATPANNIGGLEKWVFNGSQWNLAYTLQDGLNLGQPYTVPGYPTGDNTGYQGLPWAPATDGLRNITGKVNRDGTATIYGVTSTVSGSGDQGADPNSVVEITDNPAASTPGVGEKFSTVETAGAGHVLRGVAVVPDGFEAGNSRDDRGHAERHHFAR